MGHSFEYEHLQPDVDPEWAAVAETDIRPGLPSKPTRIVVSGEVEVLPWPALPEVLYAEMAATVGDEPRTPSGAYKDWRYTPRPSRLQRLAAAFGIRW